MRLRISKRQKKEKNHLDITEDAREINVYIQNNMCWEDVMYLFYIYSSLLIYLNVNCEGETDIGLIQVFSPGLE